MVELKSAPTGRDAEHAQGHKVPTAQPKRRATVDWHWCASYYVIIVFAIGLLFGAIRHANQRYARGPVEVSDKPQSDSRVYLTTKLSNGLQVMAVEDPRTTQAAFAVAVDVGSYDDPEHFPGLTHYLEHMLFLGTKKYPDPDSFNAYISQSGGESNAYTADETTVYYASMSASAASEGMDRFADFFRAPLFDEDLADRNSTQQVMDRELYAVNSEHQKNTQDPGRRIYAVTEALAAPESPVGRFHTGDIETLKTVPQRRGESTSKALIDHFRRHYCTPRMHVVVVGPRPAEAQLRSAEATFGLVPQGRPLVSSQAPVCSPLAPSHAEPNPWPAGRLGKWVDVEGTTPFSQLDVWFTMPDLRKEYVHQPLDYIGYVLEYHGEGSLFHILRDRLGLAFDVSVGSSGSSAGTRMSISFALTEDGRKHPQAILHVFFAYVASLRYSGVDRKLLETLAASGSLMWEWQEPTSPASTAEDLAECLTRLPAKDVLWGGSVARQLRPEREEELLRLLVPQNANFIFVDPGKIGGQRGGSPSLKPNTHAENLPHYSVKYLVRDMVDAWEALPKQWETWLGGKPAENVRQELQELLAKLVPLEHDTNVFPEPPKPLKDVPRLSDIKLANVEAEVDDKDPDSVYGAHPERLKKLERSDIRPEQSSDIWYRRGWRSNAPKFSPAVSVNVRLRTLRQPGEPERTAADTIRMAMYQNLLAEELDVALADVGHTGGSFAVSADLDALGFDFGGLHTALDRTVTVVLEKWRSAVRLPGAEARFNRVHHTMKQSLEAYTDMPISYAIRDRSLLLTRGDHSQEDLLRELNRLSLSSVQSSLHELVFKRPLQVTSLAMGNLPQVEAQNALSKVTDAARAFASLGDNNSAKDGWELEAVTPVVDLNGVAELRKLNPRPDDPNDVAVVSVVVGVADVENRVVLSLLSQVLAELSFSILRTEKKMGYVASGGARKLSNVFVLSSVVQGDSKDADEMAAAIEHVFFKDVPNKLKKMTDEDVASRIESFVASLKEVPFHTGDEVSHFWGTTLLDNEDCFDLQREMLKYVQGMKGVKAAATKELLISQWRQIMTPEHGRGRNKLVVKYFAKKEAVEDPLSPERFQQLLLAQGFAAEDATVLKQLLNEQENTLVLKEANAENREKLLAQRTERKYFPTDVICKASAGAREEALIALPIARRPVETDGVLRRLRVGNRPATSEAMLSADDA